MKVSEATLRAYNVGFGDCLLLLLRYDDDDRPVRSVLFDFGSTKLPDSRIANHMKVIAENIAESPWEGYALSRGVDAPSAKPAPTRGRVAAGSNAATMMRCAMS